MTYLYKMSRNYKFHNNEGVYFISFAIVYWSIRFIPIEIWSSKVFNQKLDYIHNNPVVEGFVEKPYFWKYSSARNYMLDDDSLLKVVFG